MLRVMVGGVRSTRVFLHSKETIMKLAESEIARYFQPAGKPFEIFYSYWPKGIPQYDKDYAISKKNIERSLAELKGFYIAANYWGGVSFNDCIQSAYNVAQECTI